MRLLQYLPRRAWLTATHIWGALCFGVALWSGLNSARDQLPVLAAILPWWPAMDAPLFWHQMAAGALFLPALGLLWWRWRQAGPGGMALRLLRLALACLLASGALLYLLDGNLLRLLHLLAALVLTAALIWHAGSMLQVGGWRQLRAIWLTLPPRLPWLVGGLAGTALLVLCGLHLWQGSRVVQVPYIAQELRLDGVADEAAWQRAATVNLQTWYGAPKRQVLPLQIKLFHDGFSLHTLVKWPDASPSRQHLPLLKTARGWVLQQNGWASNDEQTFYEDKLAVMVGSGRWDALRSVFLDVNRNGRGGHHGPDGRVLDIWHWKSVRNHHFGKLDDAWFGPLLPNFPGGRRYSWGYASDPIREGGYKENFYGHGVKGVVQPLRLPRNPAAMAAFQKSTGGPDDPVLVLDMHDTRPWDASLDNWPVGTVLPSVVQVHHNEGDRGDVLLGANWAKGEWTLEMSRVFDTGSQYDVRLQDGVNLWFAVFDHAQTRHAWHLRPLRLQFEAGDKR